jgi:DNA replication protein DnaC
MRLIPERRRLLPHIERSLRSVVPKLLATFNSLALGELPWPLVVYGPAGTGKTCAALALADIADTAAYIEADDWASTTIQRPTEVEAELAHLCGKELLIVDELACREKVGDLHYLSLKRLIDARSRSANVATIYISNLEPQALIKVYDGRIYSRLTCGTVFNLSGPDRRKVQA